MEDIDMKNVLILTVLPLFAFSSMAYAGGAGSSGEAYLGFTVGASKTSADKNNLTKPDTCKDKKGSCSSDDSDKAWQIHGGYEFAPNLAVEGAYVNLGKTANVSNKGLGGSINATQKTKGASIAVVGKMPIGAFTGYGKAGVYHWNSKVTTQGISDQKGTVDASGTDPTIGLGVEYQVSGNWSARAGWDRYYNTGKTDALLHQTGAKTLSTDVDVYSVGVTYNF